MQLLLQFKILSEVLFMHFDIFPQLISIYGKALKETEKKVQELKSQRK